MKITPKVLKVPDISGYPKNKHHDDWGHLPASRSLIPSRAQETPAIALFWDGAEDFNQIRAEIDQNVSVVSKAELVELWNMMQCHMLSTSEKHFKAASHSDEHRQSTDLIRIKDIVPILQRFGTVTSYNAEKVW